MLDVNFIRNNINQIRNLVEIGRANPEKVRIDEWLELDRQRSSIIFELDKRREERNILSKEIVSLQTLRERTPIIEKSRILKDLITELEKQLKQVETRWQEILDWMPNIPYSEVPTGKTSDENVETKAWDPKTGYLTDDKLGIAEKSGEHMSKVGSNSDTEFVPLPHWEVGAKLGLFDLEAGAKVSGSRFYYIKGDGAILIYATFNLLIKKLILEGFTPMIVPVLVRERALYGSSHFPGDADQVYKIEDKYLEDDENSLYLVGSSEPSNFSYFADQVLDLSKPVMVTAQTPCFRTEVGSWGKDVRGIKRTHQFDKIEMNIVMEADDTKAREMQEYLLGLNEWLLQTLEIPYHVINMCIGDLGYNAAVKKYDIEFWTPSQNSFTELMSNSITTDYQARRLNIKYKDAEGKLKYAYTLNDTGVTHRVLIAIIEHYQQSDGTLKVPAALRDYVGKEFIGK